MPPPSSAAPARPTCPNCHAAVAPGRRVCSVCRLEVSKMAAFAAAKKAAQQRGIKGTQVETRGPAVWRNPAVIKLAILLLFVGSIAYLGYHFFGPKPPRYIQFKPTAVEAVREFLTLVNAGDEAHFRAYDLVADSARQGMDDPGGSFRQVFHNVNEYLSAELLKEWMSKTDLAADPNHPDLIVAKIDIETLHIRTAQVTPPDKLQKYGPHYGIVGIEEVSVYDAADLQKWAIIGDYVGAAGGQGAMENLTSILSAGAANRHQPPFIKKIGLLMALRNPRSCNWRTVVQINPMRTDPVIEARLKAIVFDVRYDASVRTVAQEVLDDKVSEEEKTAVGMPD
jgi:hypothetical protein